MQHYSTRRTDNGASVRVVSALVFLSFTFLWLYRFQADMLAYAQHVFSHGQTHYNSLVGAILITLVLWLLQWGVYGLFHLRLRLHALTYYPSVVVLALLGTICPSPSGQVTLSLWWLLLLPLTAVWGFAVVGALQFSRLERPRPLSFFSRALWTNLLVLFVLLTGLVASNPTNAVFHYRTRVETCLAERRFADALQVGSQSLETDASLTMLRAYALSRSGLLGDRLFQYPVAGSGADLVPIDSSRSRLLRYPQDSLYRHLGAIPRPGMDTPTYLSRIERYGQATAAVRDYVLCGLLIDRRLDAFARALPRYYTVSDSLPLPRHYREALTLYTHSRTNPVLEYHDAVTDEDYADLQELESQYSDPRERHIRVKEKYQGSYWYYYEYARQ